MRDLLELVRIQIELIALFVFFKLIRPLVLESSSPECMKLTLLSLPNFFEGVIGILILTRIYLYLNLRVLSEKWQIGRYLLYTVGLIFTGIYVITQELKIHNFGGDNKYFLVSVNSGQLSIEHYPFYEFLVEKNQIVKKQKYFYDLAGVEGLEYSLMAPIVEIAALILLLILLGIYKLIICLVF